MHCVLRLNEHLFDERDFKPRQRRRGSCVVRAAGENPIVQDRVLQRIYREPPATFVGNPHGGLFQQQARVGIGAVDSPAAKIAHDRGQVEFRILAAQRELEPTLAVLIAVTDSLVAAGLGQHGHHVAAEADRGRCGRVGMAGAALVASVLAASVLVASTLAPSAAQRHVGALHKPSGEHQARHQTKSLAQQERGH